MYFQYKDNLVSAVEGYHRCLFRDLVKHLTTIYRLDTDFYKLFNHVVNMVTFVPERGEKIST
jgi:hypothetical protein